MKQVVGTFRVVLIELLNCAEGHEYYVQFGKARTRVYRAGANGHVAFDAETFTRPAKLHRKRVSSFVSLPEPEKIKVKVKLQPPKLFRSFRTTAKYTLNFSDLVHAQNQAVDLSSDATAGSPVFVHPRLRLMAHTTWTRPDPE